MIGKVSDFTEMIEIGRGAFSCVYSCRNSLDDKVYALKRVTLRAPKGNYQALSAYEKVLEEVKHLSSMAHPNVVRYYSCWVSTKSDMYSKEASTQPNSGKKPSKLIGNHKDDDSENAKEVIQITNSDGFLQEQANQVDSDRVIPILDQNKSINRIHFSFSSDISNDKDDLHKANQICKKTSKVEEKVLLLELIDNSTVPSTKSTVVEFYIQTELCQTTLKDYLKERNRRIKMNPTDKTWIKEAFLIAKQLISGLIYISSEQIIHRDIKPSNIFIKENLEIKYGDFGLVKSCSDHSDNSFPQTPILSPAPSEVRKGSMNCVNRKSENFDVPFTRTRRYSCWEDDVNYDLTTNIGTTMYASPEQMGKTQYTKKSDYYSLGLVLLEVFMPLQTEMERFRVFQNIRKSGAIGKDLLGKKRLTELLQGLLQIDSSQRTALDDLLWDIRAEEANFMKEIEAEVYGPVDFSREGSQEWDKKYLLFTSEKVLFYSSFNQEKADFQITPGAFKISLMHPSGMNYLQECQKDAQVELLFSSPTVTGFSIITAAVTAAQMVTRIEDFY